MSDHFNFDNCGTNSPPQIVNIEFNVNGSQGTPDLSGVGDQSNPPIIGSEVEVVITIINEDTTTEIVTYQYALDGSGDIASSGSSINLTDESFAGQRLLCTVTVTNSVGSVSDTIDMGIIYGFPPVLPDDITPSLTTSSILNSVVNPGDVIDFDYGSGLTDLGAPNLNFINTIINGQSFVGSSFTYTVVEGEPNCKIKLESVEVRNSNPDIPNTGIDSKDYDLNVFTVSNPVDGSPCGTPLGRCCWTGGFDVESGTTFGNCDILTSAECATKGSGGGIWTEGELTCPDCDGSVGTPCCNDYGTGRCCCVQQDNSGLCVDGLTFGECNSSNPLFAQCGGSVEFPDIVWGHNLSCASSTEPPCVGPPTGRCCEVLLEGGTTCEIGLEELDCPRYFGSTFDWSESGNCPDCTDPVQNLGYPCCEPLGRCCLLGDKDSDGFDENNITYDITEQACIDLQTSEGYPIGSRTWTENQPGVQSERINCDNFNEANENPECCLPRGRCCWKDGNTGDFALNVTEEECAGLAELNTREWIEGNNEVPDCTGNQLSTNLCCDTSIGRCCENNGVSNICTNNVIFDDCNDAAQDFARGQSCPPCGSGVGAPCCNGDASITNVRFNPALVIAGESTRLLANISGDNFSSRIYEYYVNDILRQTNTITSSDFNTNINDVGLELKGVVETTDLDGTPFSEEVTTTINGEAPVLPTTLNISVSPGNNWPVSLEPGDIITITGIQTTDGNPDSTIEWQFESLNGNLLSSGSGLEPITIDYTVSASDVALEECGLKLRLTASNNLTEIPGTGSVSSVYPSPKGWTVSGNPGDLCGVAIGRCCVTGGFDPVTGITSASCTNGVSKADCDAINGAWGGENSVCPTCDGSVGTPCCPEIGTGRCCCTQTDNTGLCIDGVTSGGCTGSNPDFAGCGDSSPEGSITWFHNESCPNCADSFDPPCCAPRTGRCCEILPEGNSEGLPPGVTCAVELEEFDCPRYESGGITFEWTADGICPNCTNPQDNLNNPVCCPEKLGRCCCTTNDEIFEGFCQANVTEAECDSLCGSASQTWTENTPADMPSGLQCPDCSDPSNGLPCCNQRGRCCFKVEGDLDTPRLGRCFSGVTYGECQFLRDTSVPPAVTEIFFREDNPPCPNCGAGNNTNACCDDVDIPLGICCTNGVCDDNEGAGVLQTDCTGAGQVFDDSTLVCPDCADPDENEEGQPCCPLGYPVLSIDSVLVGPDIKNLNPISPDNPILPGSIVSIITTEENLVNVNYRFIIDVSGTTFVLGEGSKEYTVPATLEQPGISGNLAGKDILFDVTAESPLVGVPPEELEILEFNVGTVNGLPNTTITPNIVLFPANPVPSTITQGDIVFVESVETDSVPISSIQYQWLDANENDIVGQTNTFYTVTNGVIENCELKVRITADNTNNAGFDVPGGNVESQVFDVAPIIVPEGSGSPCILSGNEGTCCCGSAFDSVTGITGGTCENFVTESACNQKVTNGECVEVLWTDRDYVNLSDDFCPTCDERNGADGGADYPCCSEYPKGRCCRTGFPCVDDVFEADCNTDNGFVFEKDKICPVTPCNSSDPAEQRCGCDEDTPVEILDIEFLNQEQSDEWYGRGNRWNPSHPGLCLRQRVVYTGPPTASYEINWTLDPDSDFDDPFVYEITKDPDNDGSTDVVEINITEIQQDYNNQSFPWESPGPPAFDVVVEVIATNGGQVQSGSTAESRTVYPSNFNNGTEWSRLGVDLAGPGDRVTRDFSLLSTSGGFGEDSENDPNRNSHLKNTCGLWRIVHSKPPGFPPNNKIWLTFRNERMRQKFLEDHGNCRYNYIQKGVTNFGVSFGCPNVGDFILSGLVSQLTQEDFNGDPALSRTLSSNQLECLFNTANFTAAANGGFEFTLTNCSFGSSDCPQDCSFGNEPEEPELEGSWVNYTTGECSDTDNGGIYCDPPGFPDVTLNSLTPCDFREILPPGSPQPAQPCSMGGLCMCMDKLLSNATMGSGCGGFAHENSANGKNLIYLCEQIVKSFDPVCEFQWDEFCADAAQDLCSAANLLSVSEQTDVISVFDPIPYYEQTFTNGDNDNTIVRSEFENNWDCSRITNSEKSCIDTIHFNPYNNGPLGTAFVWTNNCGQNSSSYQNQSCKHNILEGQCTNCCCCDDPNAFQHSSGATCRSNC